MFSAQAQLFVIVFAIAALWLAMNVQLALRSIGTVRPVFTTREGLQLTLPGRQQLRTIGTLVVDEADGPAAVAGVEAGDVLIAVNGEPVTTVSEFRTAVAASGGTVALLIQRGNAQIFVPVRIDS